MSIESTPAAPRRWPAVLGRLARGLGLVLLAGWFVFAAIVLVLRYQVLPNIDHYRPDVERLASRSLGLGVSIGELRAGWDGLRPDLVLADVLIANPKGEPVLAFSRVEAVLSWRSLAAAELLLHRLTIEAPVLHVQREADGRLLVAGMPVDDPARHDASLVDWILRQHRIVIRDALLIWEDALRAAPPLFLEHLDLRLDNAGSRHRFGLTGLPPAALAGRLDLRGDLRGRRVDALGEWRGQLFAQADAVNLAAWRPWFDYPLELPRGSGGLRLWLGVEHGQAQEATADLALSDVQVRFARHLPELDIAALNGRLRGRRGAEGVTLAGRQLSLRTRAGVELPATDFELAWKPEADGQIRGRASASAIDLEVMRGLVAALPVDERTRTLLADFAPRGRVSDLKASWRGDAERASEYSLKARFDGLGAKARGIFPGFSGLAGALEVDEDDGHLLLRSGPSTLELPAVFPEPLLAFDALAASVRWNIRDGALEAELQQASFSGPDAFGSAQGQYRRAIVDGGAGDIDLTARLEQADGRAVWRYMPHVVAADARAWLRRGLVAGKASDVQLTLKGKLDRFPFRNPADGQFLVTAKAADVIVDYADGWPRIDGINGQLRFEGARMQVDAQQGRILGTRLRATSVQIPDLEVGDTQLVVNGTVEGPTAEFLRFVETSPVGERIGHVAEDMRASGNGRLELALSIPLARVDDTRIKGEYQFLGNELVVDPALPPLSQLSGRLAFTADEVSARDLSASFLGAPLKLAARTQGDRVLVTAQGSASTLALRKLYDWRVFDHLSGSTPWRAEIRARKKQADIVVDTGLQGISSSLPPPFNKSAAEVLPLRIEKVLLAPEAGRKMPALAREQWRLSLGKVASAQFIRSVDGAKSEIEQGVLAVGETTPTPPPPPDSGFAVYVTQPRLDLDLWRSLLPEKRGSDTPRLPLVVLKAGELVLLDREWHDVSLRALPTAEGLQGKLEARELGGEFTWSQDGKGRVRARLKHFTLPAGAEGGGRGGVAEVLDSLPGLDVVAEQFALGNRKLGRLEMDATNEARVWRVNRLSLANPDGVLSGSGRWRFSGGDRTQFSFKVEARDLGRLLERFGYADAIRRGTATLEGRLGWFGVPTTIDYASLSGEVVLAAEKGQFAKLEPGIGKLFSLLSLQMLPRRITLDFRDIFSEGFAFDSIGGRMTVLNGIMNTGDLTVEGPTAKVLMRGDVDLQHETQSLRVAIQPELGGTVALGAAVVNPIAGVAALIAQKILKDPLNKAFAYEYAITGSWADPKVEKVSPQLTQETPNDPAKR